MTSMRYTLIALVALILAAPATAQFDPRPTAGSPAASGAVFPAGSRVNVPFFDQTVTYRGAFAPAPGGERWDLPWANYTPQLTAYPAAGTCATIPNPVTIDLTLTTGTCYRLIGFTNVSSPATLTIQPGVVILGDQLTKGSLIINRGARLNALGTAAQPIVFTSANPPGGRAGGDWGGIIIAGRGPLNIPGSEAVLEGGTGTTYGGGATPIPNDDSGTMQYVRIEFPGIAFSTNNEINCLTTGAVGSATILDFIQCSYSGDDSFEPFGGTHDMRHFISLRALDDDLDGDNGWTGNVQFFLAVREPALGDVSGSNGIEHDNDATGSTNTPRTAPTMSNLTILGPQTQPGTASPNYRRGAHIRRSSRDALFNSVIIGWEPGVHLDGANVATDAQSGALEIKGTLVSGAVTTTEAAFNAPAWFAAQSGNQILAGWADAGITSVVVDAEPAPPTMTGFGLALAPNPAAGAVALTVQLPEAGAARVALYDVLGRAVAVVHEGPLAAGAHVLRADLSALAPGVYVVRLETPAGALTHRLVVAR